MARTKMTEQARQRIKNHFANEAQALRAAAFKAAHNYWAEAEKAAVQEFGLTDVAQELENLARELVEWRQRRSELRAKFPGMAEELTVADYQRLDLEDELQVDRYRDTITRRPLVFDKEIRTKWDGVIYKFLCRQVGLDRLRDIVNNAFNAALRRLDLAGTHEEAQEAHQEWYTLLKAGMGEKAPPLLEDIARDAPELLAGVREAIPLLSAGKDGKETAEEDK